MKLLAAIPNRLLLLASARAALAARLAPTCIAFVVCVAVRAMRASGERLGPRVSSQSARDSQPDVFCVSNWLQMIWIDARAIAAHVVYLKSGRYRTAPVLEGYAMGKLSPVTMRQHSVTAIDTTAGPHPAIFVALNFRKESAQFWCSHLLTIIPRSVGVTT